MRSIRFTVSKRVAEKRAEERQENDTNEYYQTDATLTEPLSENERQQAAYVAAVIPDDDLREAALRVMIKDLEWKKGARAHKSAETRTEGSEGCNSSS